MVKYHLIVGQCHDFDNTGKDLGPAKRYVVRSAVNTTRYSIGQELSRDDLDDIIRQRNKVTIK